MISTLVNYKDCTDNILPKGRPCILVDTETNDILYPISAGGVVSGGSTSTPPPPDDNGIINTDKLIYIPINMSSLTISAGYRFEYIMDPVILTSGVWLVTVKVYRSGGSLSGATYLGILDSNDPVGKATDPVILHDMAYPGQHWCLTSLIVATENKSVAAAVSFYNRVSFGAVTGEFIAAKIA